MPSGFPSSRSTDGPQPLKDARLEDVPLVDVSAFRARQTRKDEKTGEEYEIMSVKLSFDFDSGQMQHNADGEVIVDDNGNPKPHLIYIGYCTLSGDRRGTLKDILKALGFNGPDFIEQDGRNAGGLRDDIDMQMEFGTNGLGHDYAGKDYDDLPEYNYRDKDGPKKRDVEVPVVSWTINGYQVLGRRVDMALEIDSNGYNKPGAFLPPRNPEPLKTVEELAEEALPTAKAKPRAPVARTEANEPVPTKKGPKWVWDTLEELLVPVEYRTPVMRAFAAEPSIKNIASLDVDTCRQFRDALKETPSLAKALYEQVSGASGPEDDGFDEGADEF